MSASGPVAALLGSCLCRNMCRRNTYRRAMCRRDTCRRSGRLTRRMPVSRRPPAAGDKMSASDPASKIDLLEPEAKVKSKLKKVFCEEGNIEKNPLLDWISGVFFIIYDGAQARPTALAPRLLSSPTLPLTFCCCSAAAEFRIPQREADDLVYKDFASLQADFRDKKIHPGDLKQSVQLVINKVPADCATPLPTGLAPWALTAVCRGTAWGSSAAGCSHTRPHAS